MTHRRFAPPPASAFWRAAALSLAFAAAACSTTPPPPPAPASPRAVTERTTPVPRVVPLPEARESYELEPRLVESFRSDGKLVRVDVIRAQGVTGKRPAVLMLHGASGLGNGWLIYPHGEELARRGIDVFVVRYYDGLVGNDGAKSSSALHYRREEIVSDAISFVAARPDIDPERIGIYGMSLGAFQALALGTHDERVAAIANVMGAMPGQVPLSSINSMPPTLLIHGARDRIVPIERMYDLASRLDEIGAPYEVKVYTDQAHNLAGPAHVDSILTVADFFDRRLNGGSLVASAGVPVSARTLTSLGDVRPVMDARAAERSRAQAAATRTASAKKRGETTKVAAKAGARPAAKAGTAVASAKPAAKAATKSGAAPAKAVASKAATAPAKTVAAKAAPTKAAATKAVAQAKPGGGTKVAAAKPAPTKAATAKTASSKGTAGSDRSTMDRNQIAATR